MGFYSKGSIHPLVPKILATYDEVTLVKDRHDGELGVLVQRLLLEGRRPERGLFKILMLSSPDSPDTLRLERAIPNDKLSQSGKTTAFTMGQRYVASEQLKQAKTTSELDEVRGAHRYLSQTDRHSIHSISVCRSCQTCDCLVWYDKGRLLGL